MESKKVKEIKVKEFLETLCYKYKDVEGWEITKLQLMNILTLINELESNYQNVCVLLTAKNEQLCDLTKENQQLKNRIAELEKENKTKTDTITDLLKKQEFYEKEKLTKFAERVKENLDISVVGYSTEEVVNGVNDTIDETLKEFIGK